MNLPRRASLFLPLIVLLFGAAMFAWRSKSADKAQAPVTSRIAVEASPMCPWRQPAKDMAVFFPGATNYKTETLILTSHFREFKKRLGRLPTPDENPLYLHRIYAGAQQIGSILVRRVKGEYGAIEIVVAFAKNGSLVGVKIQRIREPEVVAKELNAEWLGSFKHKTSDAPWELGHDVPPVPVAAQVSAQVVVEGVRNSLILHELGAVSK